jgi:hypothetical protein
MKIIIPTYRRTGSQHTFKAIPEDWKQHVVFVTDEKDGTHMQSFSVFKDIPFCIVPPEIDSIAKKRAWILKKFYDEKSIAMMDDDLRFAVRQEGTTKLVEATHYDVGRYLSALERQLGHYAHAGFSARQGNNTKPEGWEKNTRMMYVLGYNPKVVVDNCELGRIETREDFDYTLQLLRKGFENVVCNNITTDQKYNAPGEPAWNEP